jgi:small subunit ribosomal protein S16
MVRIRLKRLGRKKRPFYRIVVTDQRNRRDGAPICELGYYDPIRKQLKLNKTEAAAWMVKGAQPSDTVARLLQLAPEGFELFEIPKAVKVAVKEEAATAAAE